jgi:hypothetical protein
VPEQRGQPGELRFPAHEAGRLDRERVLARPAGVHAILTTSERDAPQYYD